MRVNLVDQGNVYHLAVHLDADEDVFARGQWDAPIEMTTTTASLELKSASTLHPDLAALAVLMIVRPWVKRRLTLDSAVSQGFADVAFEATGVEIGPIADQIPQRERGRRHALAFSGGIDGMAADNMISGDLAYFHFARKRHPRVPNRATHLRTDASLAMIEQVVATGRSVHIATSDLEFVAARPFPTFAHWVTMAIEPVLRADDEDIGAIVMGRHIAGVYVNSGLYF
ncbi:MAG: hypothetical protein WBM90_10660, partial [Acidimicrobiia bacterium]